MSTDYNPFPYVAPLQFTLTIRLGNDVMQTPLDLSRALKNLAEAMIQHTAGNPREPIGLGPNTTIGGTLSDTYGNRVGSWGVK